MMVVQFASLFGLVVFFICFGFCFFSFQLVQKIVQVAFRGAVSTARV